MAQLVCAGPCNARGAHFAFCLVYQHIFMKQLDWLVLFGTLVFIVVYGIWKSRGSRNIEGYLLGDKSMPWWTIGLSVMATQASAITFLSTPGQAFQDGMGFIQFYFGLPIAMVIICAVFIPIFYKQKVYTAYELLEKRFDVKTRSLGAIIFLIQRGLAAGITIYAPSIILSIMLGWPLTITNLIIGILVIAYTVSGGTKAVSQTQKQQMAVMMGGMFMAGILVIMKLPETVSFHDALKIAGLHHKLGLIDTSFHWKDRYNIWSGILGGLFVAMAYFGTDQSQVSRYLGGKSIRESRLGLLMNGLLKVPMQFMILFIGVLVFVFYQFVAPPLFFNKAGEQEVLHSPYAQEYKDQQEAYDALFLLKKEKTTALQAAWKEGNTAKAEALTKDVQKLEGAVLRVRKDARKVIQKADPEIETKDTDYVFITFVMHHLPHGFIGLLLAVIFSAAMSSTSSELNALASTATVDIYKRHLKKEASDRHYLNASRWLTFGWGLFAIGFATFASLLDNLIQAVNIIGSLFYGTMLGIFLVAFFIKYIKGNAVFWAAILAELSVLAFFFFSDLGYLWFNLIGCGIVVMLSLLFQRLGPQTKRS